MLLEPAGYYWQAIRENEEAAQALGINTFRYKMYAVVLSAAMTSLAGVFFAFYYNNLFPEQVFHIGRSIELILGPIIGGIGTLFGPIVGAFVLTGARRGAGRDHARLGIEIPGVKQVFYGVCLLLVVMFLPDGIWPPLSKALGLHRTLGQGRRGLTWPRCSSSRRVEELQRPARRAGCELRRSRGRDRRR